MKSKDLSIEAFLAFGLVKFSNQSLFITGKAGTGKSTLIEVLEKETGKNFLKLSYSGIAAQNIGGLTINSAFKIPFEIPKEPQKFNNTIKDMINSVDSIIIDEISFVSKKMFDYLEKILRFNINPSKPFGGKQIILVGDLLQLPPVKSDEMFFDNHLVKFNYFQNIILEKVYRQEDLEFVQILDKIRTGTISMSEVSALNEICGNKKLKNPIRLTAHNQNAENYNERMLGKIKEKEHFFEGILKGDFKPNDVITPITLKIKKGAKVMLTKNNWNKGYINGTQGEILEIFDDHILIKKTDNVEIRVSRETWTKNDPITNERIGSFTQFPLILGWAITIHKSQGLTFGNVEIDLGQGAFEYGQVYTALSRCKSLEGLSFVNYIYHWDIRVNPEVLKFNNNLNNEKQRKMTDKSWEFIEEKIIECEEAGIDF